MRRVRSLTCARRYRVMRAFSVELDGYLIERTPAVLTTRHCYELKRATIAWRHVGTGERYVRMLPSFISRERNGHHPRCQTQLRMSIDVLLRVWGATTHSTRLCPMG